GAAEPAVGAEAPVAAGPADGLVVGEGPGDRAGADAAGDRAAEAEAPEPAAAALRAGAGGAADRLVLVEAACRDALILADLQRIAAAFDWRKQRRLWRQLVRV